MPRKISLLYFAHAPFVGGTLRQLYVLCKKLDKHRFEPTVICSSSPSIDEYADSLKELGINVVRLTIEGKLDVRHILMFFRFLRQNRFDILHVHLSEPFDSMSVFVAAKLAGVPLILASERLMCNHPHVNQRRYSTYLKKWLCQRVIQKTIAVSQAVRSCLISQLHISPDVITVIHNAILLEKFSACPYSSSMRNTRLWPFSSAKNVIGFVGHIIEDKGIFIFLDAARILLSEYPDSCYLVIGEGQDLERAKQFAHGAGLDSAVAFLGYQDNVAQWFDTMDIVVCPSFSESFGNVLVEALAMQCPVVTTGVGIASEIIEHQHNGMLVPVNNVPALVDAVGFLLEHPQEAQEFGERGRELVEKMFNPERIMKQFENLYVDQVKQ